MENTLRLVRSINGRAGSSQVRKKLKKLSCSLLCRGNRLQFRRQSVATSASRLYNFREYERALTMKTCHGRSNHVYMDAQWHNLRAVVPAIRVDLIVSVRQPTLINASIIDFPPSYFE